MAGLKPVLLAIATLLIGLAISLRYKEIGVAIVAVITILSVMGIVNRAEKSNFKELLITGLILGGIEAYTFLVQPNWSIFPALPQKAELFFGIAALARTVLLLLEYVDNPLRKYVLWVVGR